MDSAHKLLSLCGLGDFLFANKRKGKIKFKTIGAGEMNFFLCHAYSDS